MTGIPAEHSAVLPCEPASARLARAFVRDFCDYTGLPPEVQDDAMLLTSEIVANAVTHGRSEVRLSVRVAPAGIRVEVGDDNSRYPTLRPNDLQALDGRGLSIVEQLASQWGVDNVAYGKTVWFELST